MKATELRQKSADELQKELVELRKEEFGMRMQRSTGQMSNPSRFKVIRKDVARIKTILNEIKRGSATDGPAGV